MLRCFVVVARIGTHVTVGTVIPARRCFKRSAESVRAGEKYFAGFEPLGPEAHAASNVVAVVFTA